MINLDDVLTISEAAQIYGMATASLRMACGGQKGYPPIFKKGECRKSGSTWLITREAMERVYGKK